MQHIVISLDGNIGSGKSYLLNRIREEIPEIFIEDEPVNLWTSMVDESGQNMLELFYEDKKRWGYTFQTCALLTRQKSMQATIAKLETPKIILTERSILTDKHVFAEMLYRTGTITSLEWDLYNKLFDTISLQHKVHAVIYVSTSAATSRARIALRGRPEETSISMDYLDELDEQHKTWLSKPMVPVLTLSTEPGSSVDINMEYIKNFIDELKMIHM